MMSKDIETPEMGTDGAKFYLYSTKKSGEDRVYAFDLRVTDLSPESLDIAISALKTIKDITNREN
jgi:hypothetical protein